MNISFDVSPLTNNNKNRGIGKYTQNLLKELKKAENITITEFSQGYSIPPCDLVHYPYFDPFFLTLPIIKKYPTIVTIHDLIPLIFPKKFPKGLKGEIKWLIQKTSLKSVKAVITDSQASKKDIVKYTGFNPEHIYVVYLAPMLTDISINPEEINDLKNKYHLPNKFLLYIGDINYNKNVPNLYEAINILNSSMSLVLIGNSFLNISLSEKKQLDQLAKNLNIESRLLKLGGLTDKEIKAIYQLATAYIQPSLYEGFGLPVIEALSLGCPVVCSRGGSLPEVAGEAVIYIDPHRPQNISEGIERVLRLDDISRQEFLVKGKAQASKFSWTNTVNRTIDVYNRLAH